MSAQGFYARLPFQSLSVRPLALLQCLSSWRIERNKMRTNSRRLHVVERVSIGEKSFLSVVHIDDRRFLLASTQASVSLLTELSPEESFATGVKRAMNVNKQPVKRTRTSRVTKDGVSA